MASTDKVHFDLDAVEREQFEVFAFTVKNDAGEERRIELTDPADVDYQDLLEIDNPLGFFRYTMKESDRDFFATTRIKGWRLSRLLEAYLKHYKADERVDPRAKVSDKLGF